MGRAWSVRLNHSAGDFPRTASSEALPMQTVWPKNSADPLRTDAQARAPFLLP